MSVHSSRKIDVDSSEAESHVNIKKRGNLMAECLTESPLFYLTYDDGKGYDKSNSECIHSNLMRAMRTILCGVISRKVGWENLRGID